MNNDLRQLGRAKNSLLGFFEKSLYVPKIYLDATWDGHHVDLLAIDRDGSGDVHAVLLFLRPYFQNGEPDLLQHAEALDSLLNQFTDIPAQFKYIVRVDVTPHRALLEISPQLMDKSFSLDGIGRVGFVSVDIPSEDEPRTQIQIKPERFRAKIAKLADDYVEQHTADWEIRA